MTNRAIRALFFLFLLLTTSSFLTAKEEFQLEPSDVRKVMDQLFDYHIDKKEISPLILARSLKCYIQQFDSEKIYFLEEEVASYLTPSPSLLQKMLVDYQEDKFLTHQTLNALIANSIQRARQWRREWEASPNKVFQDIKKIASEGYETPKLYTSTLPQLKERSYRFFLKLVAAEMKLLSSNLTPGKEAAFLTLCEKHFVALENPYLGRNEEGKPLQDKGREHLVLLRTIKALAHSLDAHTAYYSPEEAKAMKVQLEKGMCGIGVVLHEGIEGVVIAEIVKGGPADQIGKLKVGDTIVEVDGEPLKHASFQKVLDVLRGEEGSQAILGIERCTSEEKYEYHRIELTRSKIVLEDKRVDIAAVPFGDGFIGKITLYSFYESEDGVSSEKDIRNAILDLKKKGPLYGLVLDLRENSGGFLSQAVRVSSLFISSGIVVISKYSDDTLKFYRSVEGVRFYDGPLLVLISKGSASASEIVAQGLQDYGVALVVGDSQSFGKGTVQHQTVTSEKSFSFFKVTIGRYYTVSGKSTQIDGVKADITVPTELQFERMGEEYLDYPLSQDQIAAYYKDPLSDLDAYAKRWFTKYYLPTLQPKSEEWSSVIKILRDNSTQRLKQSLNFQNFLKKVKKEAFLEECVHGVDDLQMQESINILKDMIFLKKLSLRSASATEV